MLVDTAGIAKPNSDLEQNIKAQILEIADTAKLIIVVVDAGTIVTTDDAAAIKLALKQRKPLILVANKADGVKEVDYDKYYKLGLKEVVGVSAIHGQGTGDLLDMIVGHLPKIKLNTRPTIKIALLGRPNVGKSSLLNSLSDQPAALVSAEAGTTRDINRLTLTRDKVNLELFDTAGIRKSGKIGGGIERFSYSRTQKAIEAADIGVVILDADEAAVAVDQKIAGLVTEAGKGLILVANKWDLVDLDKARFEHYIQRRFQFVWWAPLVETSALTKQNIELILDLAIKIAQTRQQKLATSKLNKLIVEGWETNSHFKVKYLTQVGTNPPTFALFISQPNLVHFSYRRQIENRLRKEFEFTGTPIKLEFRSKWKQPLD